MGVRNAKQRKALLMLLSKALFEKSRIETTEGNAKAVRPFVEKIITKTKNEKNLILAQRSLSKIFSQKETRDKIIKEITPKYQNRPGGYTRIYKLGQRQSDGAKMAIIELVE